MRVTLEVLYGDALGGIDFGKSYFNLSDRTILEDLDIRNI